MKNKKIVVISVVAVIIFALVIILIISKNKKKEIIGETKVEDKVETKEFNYTLYGNKSDLYKTYFQELKEELTKDVVSDDEYAKIISKLFIADFFSLDDKKTNTDIGGLDFIYEEMKENFILKAKDTIYKNIKLNVYGDRKQSLPKVKSVEITSASKKQISIENANDPLGYEVVANVTYEEELGYQKEITLSIVHKDKKLYIVEVK